MWCFNIAACAAKTWQKKWGTGKLYKRIDLAPSEKGKLELIDDEMDKKYFRAGECAFMCAAHMHVCARLPAGDGGGGGGGGGGGRGARVIVRWGNRAQCAGAAPTAASCAK